MTSPIYVLLLTYFLKGGLVLTNHIVAHSELDCRTAAPLIQKIEIDKKEITAFSHKYRIESVDVQCIRVPAVNLI